MSRGAWTQGNLSQSGSMESQRENPKLDHGGVYTNWGHQVILNMERKWPKLYFIELIFANLWRINGERAGEREWGASDESGHYTKKPSL